MIRSFAELGSQALRKDGLGDGLHSMDGGLYIRLQSLLFDDSTVSLISSDDIIVAPGGVDSSTASVPSVPFQLLWYNVQWTSIDYE